MAAAETACRAALRRLGAAFKDRPAETEPEGCVIAHPVEVTSLTSAVELEPEALLKCAMAETAARFVKQVVAPAARKHLGASLKSVRHASAYVCRPRNGSSKLSEHAFGNALDFSAFELEDGRLVEVGATKSVAEQQFLDAIRKAACGPFKTVLGPGSDADHSDHFHLDLAPRRRGSTFCQ